MNAVSHIRTLANNQIIVSMVDGSQVLFSYETKVALRGADDSITLNEHYWDYSATTLKYVKQFMNTTDSKSAIQKQIDNGTIGVF